MKSKGLLITLTLIMTILLVGCQSNADEEINENIAAKQAELEEIMADVTDKVLLDEYDDLLENESATEEDYQAFIDEVNYVVSLNQLRAEIISYIDENEIDEEVLEEFYLTFDDGEAPYEALQEAFEQLKEQAENIEEEQ